MKEKKLSSSLKNEQNILKEINNDYVVNSYFIFQDKKNYYFVMEYLPGGDVYTLLSKNNLPKKTIQLIVAETILAVNYLHNISIIHHDRLRRWINWKNPKDLNEKINWLKFYSDTSMWTRCADKYLQLLFFYINQLNHIHPLL